MKIVGIDIVVLSSGFHQSVQCKVLDACHHRCGVCQRCALIAVHHGFGYAAAEVRVFAAALADTSPAAVMTHIHHRREGPAYTIGCCLAGSDLCRLLDGIHIPGAGECQRDRKDGFIAVNNIHAEQQRYTQSALLDGYALHLAYRFDPLEVEQTAYPALTYIFRHVTLAGSTGDDVAGYRQVELPKFLLEGHLCHQFVNKHAHLRVVAGCVLMPAAGQHNRYCQTGKRYNEKRFLHILIYLFAKTAIIEHAKGLDLIEKWCTSRCGRLHQASHCTLVQILNNDIVFVVIKIDCKDTKKNAHLQTFPQKNSTVVHSLVE